MVDDAQIAWNLLYYCNNYEKLCICCHTIAPSDLEEFTKKFDAEIIRTIGAIIGKPVTGELQTAVCRNSLSHEELGMRASQTHHIAAFLSFSAKILPRVKVLFADSQASQKSLLQSLASFIEELAMHRVFLAAHQG